LLVYADYLINAFAIINILDYFIKKILLAKFLVLRVFKLPMQRANNSITVPKGYAIFIVGNDGEIGSLMPFNAITCDLPTIGGYEGLYKVVKIE
jgi:hypothetical protein